MFIGISEQECGFGFKTPWSALVSKKIVGKSCVRFLGFRDKKPFATF